MPTKPDINSLSIVLLGDFNPAILTPAWFASTDLITRELADSADLAIAHKQVTQFEADWLRLEATTDRFSAATVEKPYNRVADLVARIFNEQLHHTPLRALGINREAHFRVGSQHDRDRIGRTLVPIEPWGSWVQTLGLDQDFGGMTSLTMSQMNPSGRSNGGQINITVEPSRRVGRGLRGIYVRVNDHYAAELDNSQSANDLIDIMMDKFEESTSASSATQTARWKRSSRTACRETGRPCFRPSALP